MPRTSYEISITVDGVTYSDSFGLRLCSECDELYAGEGRIVSSEANRVNWRLFRESRAKFAFT